MRKKDRQLTFYPFSQFVVRHLLFHLLIIVNFSIVKEYPARLYISGKDWFWRSINRDASRSLGQLKDNKVMKKRD